MQNEEKAAEMLVKAAKEAAKPEGPYVDVYRLTPRLKRELVGRFVFDPESKTVKAKVMGRGGQEVMDLMADGFMTPDRKKSVSIGDGMEFLEGLGTAYSNSSRYAATKVLGK